MAALIFASKVALSSLPNINLNALYGLLFGPLMYIVYFTVTGGWEGFLPMWIAGIPYDLLHAVSNFFTVLFLFAPLSKVMGRFADSYN